MRVLTAAAWMILLITTSAASAGTPAGRVCDAAGVSIANWMAGHGWAVPYRDCKCEEVRKLSKDAELWNAGIWGGEFIMPWEWREAN